MLGKKLRAKPNEVEAVRYAGGKANAMEIVAWIREHSSSGTARYGFEMVELHLEKGVVYVEVGQWVIHDEENGLKVISDKNKKYRYEEVSA